MRTISVETIPHKAIIKLDMPGGFFHRLQQTLIYHSQQRTPEELVASLKKLANNEDPKDDWEYHLFTLTILINEIEKEAKKQGQIEVKDIEIEEKPSA